MNDDTRIPLDNPTVKEVLSDLERQITQKDRDAFEHSVTRRGLMEAWESECSRRETFCETTHHLQLCRLPPIGARWSEWFDSLRAPLIGTVLSLLADAGVLGTAWFLPARDRVFEERGWR